MTKHAVELLGAKQMYLIGGNHQNSTPYQWDKHPAELGVAGITRTTRKQWDEFFVAFNGWLDLMCYKRITDHGATTGTASERKSMDDPSRWAPSPQHVLDLLKAWPNTPENVPTHEDFVAAMAAIKTSLGPSREDYWPDVLEWALEYPGNTEEYVRRVWDSFR